MKSEKIISIVLYTIATLFIVAFLVFTAYILKLNIDNETKIINYVVLCIVDIILLFYSGFFIVIGNRNLNSDDEEDDE